MRRCGLCVVFVQRRRVLGEVCSLHVVCGLRVVFVQRRCSLRVFSPFGEELQDLLQCDIERLPWKEHVCQHLLAAIVRLGLKSFGQHRHGIHLKFVEFWASQTAFLPGVRFMVGLLWIWGVRSSGQHMVLQLEIQPCCRECSALSGK